MTWYAWAMADLVVFGTLAAISQVGKERAPLTGEAVVVITIVNSLFIWGIVALAAH